ncbi:MAG: hypothetical protein WCG47_24860, partial [Dermatophilaceae bacterium]
MTLTPTRAPHGGSAEDQQLFQGLRRALRAHEPLELLATVSALLQVTDPRSRDPFARDQQRTSLDELVDSFVDTPFAETTAARSVMRAMAGDEVMAARIGRELATQRRPMPHWLTGLERARVEPDVWLLTHVLGDGDDYLFGVTLPSGHALSTLVYVDHQSRHGRQGRVRGPRAAAGPGAEGGHHDRGPRPVAHSHRCRDRPGGDAGSDRARLTPVSASFVGELADVPT